MATLYQHDGEHLRKTEFIPDKGRSIHADIQGVYRLCNRWGYPTSLKWTILDIKGFNAGRYVVIKSGSETICRPLQDILDAIQSGILRKESQA